MEPKRLFRSRSNKVFGGVAGGIAEYFSIDPVVIRVLFAIALFAGGGGFLIYLVLWIAVPQNTDNPSFNSQSQAGDQVNPIPDTNFGKEIHNNNSGALIGGAILIAAGTLLLFQNVFDWFSFKQYWPLLLVAIGVIILFTGIRTPKQ